MKSLKKCVIESPMQEISVFLTSLSGVLVFPHLIVRGSRFCSPQNNLGFLFLDLHPPGVSTASSSYLLRLLLSHHLSHTTLSHTIFHTQLCHTPSFTHSFVTHHLSHTIFVTHNVVTHNFVTYNSVTYNFVTHNFVTHNFVTHTIFHF